MSAKRRPIGRHNAGRNQKASVRLTAVRYVPSVPQSAQSGESAWATEMPET